MLPGDDKSNKHSFFFFTEFELPLILSVEYGPLTQLKSLENVAKFMSSDIAILNKLLMDEKICATVTNVRLQGAMICVGFKIKTLENLYNFEKKCDEGLLTKAFTSYSSINNLEVEAGYPYGKQLDLTLAVDEKTSLSGQIFFGLAMNMDMG